jgi:hypothetical protein
MKEKEQTETWNRETDAKEC